VRDRGVERDGLARAQPHLARRSGQRAGLAGLGWGLPLDLGAKAAQPTAPVVCIAGDDGVTVLDVLTDPAAYPPITAWAGHEGVLLGS
jgi:thiamine pyrophosphate-dependent acetolactate synthase large subunit-like protein